MGTTHRETTPRRHSRPERIGKEHVLDDVAQGRHDGRRPRRHRSRGTDTSHRRRPCCAAANPKRVERVGGERATLTQTLVFLVLGAAFGFLGGVFGIGGGIVAIPILGIVFGLNEQLAQGTAIVMVAPNAIVGLWRYLTAVKIDWRIVIAIAIPAFPITVYASHVATMLPSRDLRVAFASFTVLLAAYMWWRATRLGKGEARAPVAWYWASIVGIFTGVLSGLFTIGGAIFAVPILSGVFGLSQLAAQATSLAFVTPGIVLSLWVFATAGDVNWSIGIPLALGGVFAVPFGVTVASRLPDRVLRFAFVGFLLACAVGLFLRARAG